MQATAAKLTSQRFARGGSAAAAFVMKLMLRAGCNPLWCSASLTEKVFPLQPLVRCNVHARSTVWLRGRMHGEARRRSGSSDVLTGQKAVLGRYA